MDIIGSLLNFIYVVAVGVILGFFIAGVIGVIVLGIVKLKERISKNSSK